MNFGLGIAAILMLSAVLSYRYKETIYNTLPVSMVVMMLALYVLAFARGLGLIGIISAIFIILTTIFLYKKKILVGVLRTVPWIQVVVFGVFLLAVRLLTSDLVFNWWDDINFWSSDVKQLYYLGGFPGKYGNVSPEFGDYPPAGSLIKVLFAGISGKSYDESLQFFGYFTMNLVFLLPLYGAVKEGVDAYFCMGKDKASGEKRSLLPVLSKGFILILSFASIVLFPGIFSGIVYYGTPADITMGIVYGVLLYFIYDREECDEVFYYIRLFLMTSMLLLTKSVGIEWAIYALVFYFVINSQKSKKMIPAVLGSGAVYVSWIVFCLINRRVAKLTGAGIKMATSGAYEAPANAADKAKFFMQGFWSMPMHADSNVTFDISTGVAVVIIFVLLAVLAIVKAVHKKEAIRLAVFLGATALLTYGIIFLAHISIFMTEDQYLDAYAMSVSIARYGCPFALGGMYLLISIFYKKAQKPAGALACCFFAVFVLLTSDYKGIYGYLFDHKQDMRENAAYVDEMVGEDGKVLADKVFSDKELWGKRVLVMRDGHTYHWVHNAYISGKASPVALVYDGFMAESDSTEAISDKIAWSHASYLYIEDNEMISKDLFAPLFKEGTEFESGRIYRINYDNGGVSIE